MNKLLLLVAGCVLCTGSAAAQNLAIHTANGEPQMLNMEYDHGQRAMQTGLAQEQDIRERSEITYAHGERPLWEFIHITPSRPLGDVARDIRQERATGKKAVVTWNNQ